ncbi:transposase [Pyxidicoccus xibeiensis]|uniref:transposase n=1 Tax=Pyxidicoccus xibeiensis TaxID=2906759 RepID=UPI0021155667|nr:transposase [Pyxidicoccus xibeiensis]
MLAPCLGGGDHVRHNLPPASTPDAGEHVEVERPPQQLGPVHSRRSLLHPLRSGRCLLSRSRLLLTCLGEPGRNFRVAVCGAIHFPTRQFLFTHQPKSASTALFLPLLKRLVRRAKRTGRRIVLVLDNGVPFNSRLAQMALEAASPYVRAFRLPKYTSETLNWIENFWGHLKKTYFSRMLTEQREAFYPDAVRLLRRLRRSGHLRHLALRAPPERI